MNLANLELDLYRRLGMTTTPPTEVTTRFRAYMNQTQREILSQKGLSSLRRMTLPFSSVATDPFAVLPQSAVRIISIVDRTNQIFLAPTMQSEIREQDPGLVSTSATPYNYAIVNLASAVARDPAAAAELFTKSDNGGDGGTQKVFVEGIVTGGYPRLASVAMNGVTAVSLGAPITTWIAVTKFYLATTTVGVQTTAVGNVTLHSVSGAGTELSRIPIGKAYPRYSRIQLFPTPSAALTYHADVEIHIEDMTQATDESYMPEDFSWLLTSGAILKEYQRLEKTAQYDREKATFRSGLLDLKLFVSRQQEPGEMGPRRFSQLGPYFPVGS